MEPIKIILADDHPLVRGGIKSIFKKNADFDIIAEAENGQELLKILETKKPDVVLADISMPLLNGLEAIPLIKQISPHTNVIILTMHEEADYVIKSVSAGANGYLLKNVEADELLKAVRTVADGGRYFSANVSTIIVENLTKPAEAQPVLTPREVEILQMVAQGLSTKMIADQLNISIRTVETHRINLLRKLNVNNTAEMIKKSVEKKII